MIGGVGHSKPPDGSSTSPQGASPCCCSSLKFIGTCSSGDARLGVRCVKIGACRASADASARPMVACRGGVLAHRFFHAERLLAACKADRGIERRAGNAERDCAEAKRIGILWLACDTAVLARGVRSASSRGDANFSGMNSPIDRVAVGASALQADDVPDVVQRGRWATGNSIVPTTGAPPGARALPSASMTCTWQPSQLA